MKIVFGTATRSGSEFLVRLTKNLLGDLPQPYAAVTPGRQETLLKLPKQDFKDKNRAGRGWMLFQEHGVQALKLEEPSVDLLGIQIASAFPESKWLATVRQIEKIITSHFNISTWGWPENQVLLSYWQSIHLLEHLADQDRLFLVNLDRPDDFNLENMASYLGCEITPKARNFAENWYRLNDLEYIQRKLKQEPERKTPPQLDSLRQRHPWIDQVESRYHRLWKQCS